MAEEQSRTAQPSLAEQYELGDEASAAPSATSAVASPPPVEPEPQATERPRGPDGRYLPREGAAPEAIAEPSAPATPQHPQALTQMAQDFGISDEAIQSFTTDQLATVVRGINQQVTQRRQDAAQHQDTQATIAAAQGRIAEAQHDGAASGVQGSTPEAAGLGLDLSPYDPVVQEGFKKCWEAGQQGLRLIKSINDELNRLRHQEHVRQVETFAARCDRFFAKRDDRYGKGRGIEMQPTDANMLKRKAILSIASEDKSKASLETKLAKAEEIMFGASAVPSRASDARAEEWANAGLARPTQRNGAAEPSGPKKAEASVASRLREMGSSGESGSVNPDEDFIE